MHEDFLGFFHIPDISAQTIVSVLQDVLTRLQLSLTYLRGQCFDGASNMLGQKAGKPRESRMTFNQRPIQLTAMDTTKNCKLLSNTMDTAKEAVSPIKSSKVFSKT